MEGILKEKRRFRRIGFQVPLSYHIRGTTDYLGTLTKNISLGGMGFTSNKFSAPNTLLNLEFNILQRFFSVMAQVRWITSLPSSDNYHLGIEFLEIQPQDKRYLLEYIDIHHIDI